MSTLRGHVYREPWPTAPRVWHACVGSDCVGSYPSQPEALAAVCQRLKDETEGGDA